MTLIQRLREDAEHHAEVANQCDCRPEDTINWQHRCNALEAADSLEQDMEAIKRLERALAEYILVTPLPVQREIMAKLRNSDGVSAQQS